MGMLFFALFIVLAFVIHHILFAGNCRCGMCSHHGRWCKCHKCQNHGAVHGGDCMCPKCRCQCHACRSHGSVCKCVGCVSHVAQHGAGCMCNMCKQHYEPMVGHMMSPEPVAMVVTDEGVPSYDYFDSQH